MVLELQVKLEFELQRINTKDQELESLQAEISQLLSDLDHKK